MPADQTPRAAVPGVAWKRYPSGRTDFCHRDDAPAKMDPNDWHITAIDGTAAEDK